MKDKFFKTLQVFFLALCILPMQSFAHELRPSIADMLIEPTQATVTLQLNLEAIVAEIGPEHVDTDDSEDAIQYNELRQLAPNDLKSEFSESIETFTERVFFSDQQGDSLAFEVTDVQVPEVGDVRLARDSVLELLVVLPANSETIAISWDETYGALILRVGTDSESDVHNQYLLPGDASQPIPLNTPIESSWVDTAWNYLQVGFVHIVPKGLDHILFVIGLFLLSTQWRSLILQVSAFTLAHTVTLALGVTGVVQLPPSIVEPLIALSIAVVCIDNVYSKKLHRWRLLLVVLFGLLHGLGFAGVLTEIGFSTGFLALSLIAFNVGVEFGQLFVIGLCMLLIGWPYGTCAWYRTRIVTPVSILIACVGFFWFVQRIAGW